MSLNTKGKLARLVVMTFLAADIALAWYSYYELREDIGDEEERNNIDSHTLCARDRINNFWKFYVGVLGLHCARAVAARR